MENEFIFEIETRQIKSAWTHYSLKASEKECEKLAKRFNVEKVNFLDAEIDVRAKDKNDFVVKGEFKCNVSEICGVTLESFCEDLKGEFNEVFTTLHINEDEEDFNFDDDIKTEVKNGMIDIGEVVSEQLGLVIPVFPKKKGTSFNFKEEKIEKESPFSVLKKISK